MRVPADHLVPGTGGDVLEVEAPVRRRQSGVQHDLVEHVAEFLAQFLVVTGVDRVDELVRLLDGVARERGVGLRAVPHAPALGSEQAVDDFDEVRDGGHGAMLARRPLR